MNFKSISIFALSLFIIVSTYAQEGGGAYSPKPGKCLSNEQSLNIIAKLKEVQVSNRSLFENFIKEYTHKSTEKFIWPIDQTENNNDPGFFGISNFVDHNLTTSASGSSLLDYNCGTRTYDIGNYNHRGTDIFTWPFPWIKMDNDEVKVVASKTGIVIDVIDNNYDRSCDFCNNCDWNAVYILHADGTVAWYGHLKENSIPTKVVKGVVVDQGETLGIVGSSGSSTGPHLHFELWDSQNYIQIIDPFEGNCNNIESSLWENQRRYRMPTVNALTTGYAAPRSFDCDTPWEPAEETYFELGDVVYFTMYLSDELSVGDYLLEIIDQNNERVTSWNHQSDQDYSASYWYWSRFLGNLYSDGIYKFRVTLNGVVFEKEFYIGQVTSTDEIADLNDHLVYNTNTQTLNLGDKLLKDYNLISVSTLDGKEILRQSLTIDQYQIPIIYNGIVVVSIMGDSKRTLSTLIPVTF